MTVIFAILNSKYATTSNIYHHRGRNSYSNKENAYYKKYLPLKFSHFLIFLTFPHLLHTRIMCFPVELSSSKECKHLFWGLTTIMLTIIMLEIANTPRSTDKIASIIILSSPYLFPISFTEDLR